VNEFRRDVQRHKPDSEYFWVELGPIPGYPDWHEQSKVSRYPFPTASAAAIFAEAHMYPGRRVQVLDE
jgi:hypothetical protein